MLWCACVLFRLGRGPADSAPVALRRVAVFQMAKLGDMVCTTPVFRALKRAHPDVVLTVFGNAINREVLEGSADVDQYEVFDGIVSVFKRARSGRFDAAVITTPDIICAMVAYLAGIPFVVVPKVVNGSSPFETLWYRSLRVMAGFAVVEHRMKHYGPGEYLRLLAPLGVHEDDTTKHLAYSPQALRVAESVTGNADKSLLWVGISPSAGFKAKNWGSKRFAALADRLSAEFGVVIFVFGGHRDADETKEMLEAISPKTRVVDLSGALSIDELKAAVSLMDLFVAPDTGPVYIAEAFGVPTVDVLGPVYEEEQAPRGDMHERVVPPGPRVAQMYLMNVHQYDAKEVERQLNAITVDQVYGACARLLIKLGA